MHRANQIILGLMGTHIVMNLYFTHKLVFFFCQICYRSWFRLCFEELRSYDEKSAKRGTLHVNTVLDIFITVCFTPHSLFLFGSSIS